MEKNFLTYVFGLPRLGENREYKEIVENFWQGKIEEKELRKEIFELEEKRLDTYQRYVEKFPVGEMTLYDNILDTAIMVGLYQVKNLKNYFSLCRGKNALELTKWFNTNYHYLVPVFPKNFKEENFQLFWNKPKKELLIHKRGVPYLIGPFTFLKLSKGISQKNFEKYLLALSEVYSHLVKDFKEVQIDEPGFVWELSKKEIKLVKKVYQKIGLANQNIYLFTYYDSLDFLKQLYDLPLKGLALDFVEGKGNFSQIKKYGFPKEKILIAGIVPGRNIWKIDFSQTLSFLKTLSRFAPQIAISNASPLYHLPFTIAGENLPRPLLAKISFAKERLEEIKIISEIWEGKRKLKETKKGEYLEFNEKVRERVKNLKPSDFKRKLPFKKRILLQKKILNFPLFPTTTIGSYPQTPEIRKKRGEFSVGKISKSEYENFINEKIKEVIRFQEEIGLDVLVHGEFERSDMVEFFAQRLKGFATTKNGWVLSYGTRVYRPPIIYGDVWREKPLTLREICFSQKLTQKPVKGMLTCPITILAWSFVREDISLTEIVFQIALSLRDEVRDYEKKGIKVVQLDEPAFREKAPLKKRNWPNYFQWAIKAFNLVATGASPKTKVQTHMCYSEFDEIIEHLLKLEFDTLLIESARSRGEMIKSFEKISFDKEIGFGVWDIHSPEIPKIEEMEKIVKLALRIFPKEKLWLNPDCGLKTRNWKEVILTLKNLVKLAEKLRKNFKI